jgi:Fic family protein
MKAISLMSWNWQQPDWPNFTWEQARLAKAEQRFLVGGGVIAGARQHLGSEEHNQLVIEAITSEALTTSEIEGEVLDRASVQSSIRRALGLTLDNRRVRPAEQGIAEMMVDLYRTSAVPLADEILSAWHRMVTNGRRDLKDVGNYRTFAEPMQVVSGPIDKPKVHFEAPPSARVAMEMTRFIAWFNRTAPGGDDPLPALTRAGIAHLYFESIHPFEDGNGRVGRAVAEKALAQSLAQPTIIALATAILAHRHDYYTALEGANRHNEITEWLAWFAGISIEAQQRTLALTKFLIEKTRLLDRLAGKLNERQQKALIRVFEEGPQGFAGGLSAGNYMTITRASPATATRDLADLVEQGAFVRVGEQRYARYHPSIPIGPQRRVVIDHEGQVTES